MFFTIIAISMSFTASAQALYQQFMNAYANNFWSNYNAQQQNVQRVNVNTDFRQMGPQIVNQAINHAQQASYQEYLQYGAPLGMSEAQYWSAKAQARKTQEVQQARENERRLSNNLDANRYYQLANSVENTFNILTSPKYGNGYQTTDSEGNISGRVSTDISSYNRSVGIQNMRRFQNEMREIRISLQRNGTTISQSKWETARVY